MSNLNQPIINSDEGSRASLEARIIAHAWKDSIFKIQLLNNPKVAIESFLGKPLPANIDVKVVEENTNTLYLVLPTQPVEQEELTEDQLEAIAGGKVEIGWTFVCVG